MANPFVTPEILEWSQSVGGEHFTGRLHGYVGGKLLTAELDHELTEGEAARLNLKDRSRGARYSPGERSSRCETRETVLAEARTAWRRHYPDGKVLLVGSFASAEPQECLEGPAWFKAACNRLWRLREATGGYEADEALAGRIYRRYARLERRLLEEVRDGRV